jgi:type VI secretion system protein ImpJ
MTWHNKVIWTEGMFLQPQHFQQHDRFLARQAHLRFSITQPYGWGFMSLSLDAASLTLGKIAIAGAHGVLPDGARVKV